MKNTIILIAVSMLTCGFESFSQGPNLLQEDSKIVKGQVIDSESGKGLEFATISIFDKSNDNVIDGTLSSENGTFEFTLSKPNVYLKIEYISYEEYILDPVEFPNGENILNLGAINLYPNSQILDDVEIVAEKSETIFALDKKVFTVGKDLANRGGSAEDVLDNVPSVTVDIDGNVSLRGSEGVRMLIDGRPSGLAGVGNANGLRSIPANLIEKVEVITNPSARYEAEGMAGIINIILKKNQAGGFNGSFDITTGLPLRTGLSSNLNYRKGKINWFANYGINLNRNEGGGTRVQDRLISSDPTDIQRQITLLDRDMDRESLSNSFRFGMDYFIQDNEQLTASFLYRDSNDDNLGVLTYSDYIDSVDNIGLPPLWESQFDSKKALAYNSVQNQLNSNSLYNITTRSDEEIEDEMNLEYSLNYRKTFSSREHFLNASGQFRKKGEDESSILKSVYQENLPGSQVDEDQKSTNSESQQTWLFQLDYVHPLGKDHKFETGLRSSFREIKNDYIVEEFIGNEVFILPAFTNNFLYDEDIHAAYAIYGNTFKKFSYQAGLRAETSVINTTLIQDNISNDRTYTNLFPSGHLNYNFSIKSALQLSYSRRVRRPRFWDLNPFFTFSDNRNFFSGNPNIDPEFTDAYEIGQIQYWDDISVNSSLFYRKTNASILRVIVINLDDISTLTTPLNIGTSHDYGLDFSISYSGLKWLRLDANCNVFQSELYLDPVSTELSIYDYYRDVRNYSGSLTDFGNEYNFTLNEFKTLAWNGRITSRISFWDSDLQLRFNYRAARETVQGNAQGVGSINVGWSKDFLESKNLTLTLSARDLFNSRKRNSLTLLEDYYEHSEFQWRGRTVTLTASYRINQKKKRGGNREGNFEGDGEF
ncbi:MAG: TonB-dependent receptor [Saprospiraceae bacterium]|nr:TonB-dependent receptor [Bacteroidia bacterium]NNL91768.1 TonB-dependent receptor [Saprospiraceae bacterium]